MPLAAQHKGFTNLFEQLLRLLIANALLYNIEEWEVL
jgi:hypothetical protein